MKTHDERPMLWVAGLIGLSGLLCGLVILAAYLFGQVNLYKNQSDLMEKELRDLEVHVNNAERSVHALTVYNSHLHDLTTAIGPEQDSGTVKSLVKIRGVLDRLAEFNKSEGARGNLKERMARIAHVSSSLETTLRGVTTVVGHQSEVLKSIPTITPTSGWVSSFYGRRQSPFIGKEVVHRGLDIGAEHGTDIVATADGVVHQSGRSHSYGKIIVIKHANNIMTKYAHNAVNLVRKGQLVKRGEVIARVGSTGRSTGPHLHYEVLVNKKQVNPEDYLLDREMALVHDINSQLVAGIGGEEYELGSAGSNLHAAGASQRSTLSPEQGANYWLQIQEKSSVFVERIGWQRLAGIACITLGMLLFLYACAINIRPRTIRSV